MSEPMTCGEAVTRLLAEYGVTTVFGIPGVHTLDFCSGLSDRPEPGRLRHVLARSELGAGFMAEGWARATGNPGVALLISGPGVTNAATALGQCWADSLPMLMISSEARSNSIGKGWGVLHEVTEQKRVTNPLTALSATARTPDDVPTLMAQVFAQFRSQRPRPAHISIPTDVLAMPVNAHWQAVAPPSRPAPDVEALSRAAAHLANAKRPVILIGGGATEAAADIRGLAERLGAAVICSTAGKGIVPDAHPLSLSASTVRPETRSFLAGCDLALAIGTELSETDSFVERLELPPVLIRIDIDARKLVDLYPADVAVQSDAAAAVRLLRQDIEDRVPAADAPERQAAMARAVAAVRAEIKGNLTLSERRHGRAFAAIAAGAPADTIWSGDVCQLVYSGAFLHDTAAPRHWFYAAGYCALGNGLPNAIGARLARPDTPVAALVGDGGVMFTIGELVTAAELQLPIPVIVWENGGMKQIQDDMDDRGIARVGVEGRNPDFGLLGRACGCATAAPESTAELTEAIQAAFSSDRPTVITLREGEGEFS